MICVICGEPCSVSVAYLAPNGPVCEECAAGERKAKTKLRKKRKRKGKKQ